MSASMSANVEIFAGHRDRLFGIAYRMLGSRADAEDVLQDAWLRWHEQDAAALRSTEAWLTTMVTRLAIDRLRAAKTQRATYLRPVVARAARGNRSRDAGVARRVFASDLSVAFMHLLERLGEEERAAFVLHDASIATTTTSLKRTEQRRRRRAVSWYIGRGERVS
jgi:RNA polymerase sigma-70 factor (ECF subfamily)